MTADFGGLRMKHLIKIIALISALCIVLGGLSGCGEAETQETLDLSTIEMTNVADGVVAENEYFTMSWKQSTASIEFVSKKDGSVWGTTPKSYSSVADASMLFIDDLINSSLVVKVRNAEQTFEYPAYSNCILNSTFSSEKITNGISVTYYYEMYALHVTVDYYLEDDGFKVKVDPTKIKSYYLEDGSINKVISVTPAPFMCSSKNTAAGNKDSYMVVPSGSGALMYVDQRSDATAREFTGKIYGDDPTVEIYEDKDNNTIVTMPFYGIKVGANALCAIVEQGAESATIKAESGNPLNASAAVDYTNPNAEQIGFSYIAASYDTIGHNNVYAAGSWREQYNDAAEQNLNPLVIGYYPLSEGNANYSGMAKRYQKYLVDKEGLTKSQDNSLLTVKLYGTFNEDDLFLGLPTTNEVALTSYEKATEILGELKTVSGGSLIADMYAYGDGGINANQLAGGYSLTGAAGDKTDLKNFVQFTNDNSIKTFFNFDTVTFYESGNGYSTSTDSAINVNGTPAPVYQYWHSTRGRFEKSNGGKVGTMVAREQLAEATGDAVALATEFGITGIAFDTLGNICYSDYAEDEEDETISKYPLANNMGSDVKAIIADTKANSKTVLVDGANAYAAVSADVITAAPTASNRNNSLDIDVPLYQIVFQGYKSISVDAINMATNRRTQFLKAIEVGSGLSFALTGEYHKDLYKQYMRGLQTTLYSDNKAYIEECVNESKSYLVSVAGAQIKTHEYITNDVVKTVFDNGVTVYVNYGDTDYKSDIGIVKAEGFLSK